MLVDVGVLGVLPLVEEPGGVKNVGVLDVVLTAAVAKVLELLLLLFAAELGGVMIGGEAVLLVVLDEVVRGEDILSVRAGKAK